MQSLAAIATAIAGIVGLILYVLQRREKAERERFVGNVINSRLRRRWQAFKAIKNLGKRKLGQVNQTIDRNLISIDTFKRLRDKDGPFKK